MDTTTVTDGKIVSVHGTARRSPRAEAARLLRLLDDHPDVGSSQEAATEKLERRASAELGKQAALLLPAGKMAQQIALRIHADRRPGRRSFVAHPANHLTVWEDENYARLHGMHARLSGDAHTVLSVTDLQDAWSEDIAVALWELPQRDLGGELPTWEELQRQLTFVKARGAAGHLDGARIWQVTPFYDRSVAEICEPFDSVYVSLYKDLEAPRGAILAGDEAFIREARIWRHRLGGTIDEAWPLALLALDGLNRVTDHMTDYVMHARAVAAAISATTNVVVRPNPPQAAMFHVDLPVDAMTARVAHEMMIREGGLALALRFRSAWDRATSSFEMTFGEAASAFDPQAIAAAVGRLLELATESLQLLAEEDA